MPARAWLARVLIALVVAAGMALVIRDGVATELARSNPVRAARLEPSDAGLAVAAARAEIDGGAAPGDPAVQALVDRALSRNITLPAMIELRALRAEAEGDKGRTARLFALSDRISRRSLGTRIWLIQKSVDAGDVGGALKDFDIALRTSSAAPAMLFPVLTNAASDPQLVEPIARLLDRPSDWREMFLHYAIAERHAPSGVYSVVLKVRDRPFLTHVGADQALIGELVAQTAFAEARRVNDAFHPAAKTLVADPTFSGSEQAYPFGWRLVENGELGATRGTVGGQPALAYQALSGAGGVVATQLLTLPPGDYSLTVRAAAAGQAPPPYWTVTCGEAGGAQILNLDHPRQAGAASEGAFVVPDGCSGQWLALHLRGADTPIQSGAVAQVSLGRR